MDENEFELIQQEGEGQLIEFKESFDSKNLAKEIVAFANASGGRIFIGIDDKGIIKGLKITNKLKSEIDAIARNCDPSIKINTEVFKEVLIINVWEGSKKPYSCSQGFFLRIGANSQKMSRDEILEFSFSEGRISFDEQINEEFSFKNDFDEEKFNEYLKETNLSRIPGTNSILLNLGVARKINNKIYMNNAGVLFFSKKPSKFFMTSKVICVEYATNEKHEILDRKIFDNGVLYNIKNAISYIKKHMNVKFEIKSARRKEIPQFPEECYREAVVNAIMHRDYFDKSSDIMIETYKNKIVVYNPGGLVKWLRPEEFGNISKTRNPIIASLLARTIYVEKMGTGIHRMRNSMIQSSLPLPEFVYFDHSFYVNMFDNHYRMTSEKSSEKDSEKSSEKIIFLIREDPNITTKKISKVLGISTRAVEKILANLKKEGRVKRVGGRKEGYWKVLE